MLFQGNALYISDTGNSGSTDGPGAIYKLDLSGNLDTTPNAFSLVDQAVEDYGRRNFTDLFVAFGCTGGQHRSVYLAERLAKHLRDQGVSVVVMHREAKNWPKK